MTPPNPIRAKMAQLSPRSRYQVLAGVPALPEPSPHRAPVPLTPGWPGGHAAAPAGHGRGNGTRLSRVRDGDSGGGSVSGTNEARMSLPALGAGPRGHAPRGKGGHSAQFSPADPPDLSLPASPRLGGRLGWKCDPAPSLRLARAVWALGIWARFSERGGFTQGRQACSFKDHRGAQDVELDAVPCSTAEETGRPPVEAGPGKDPSYQIGFAD